MLPQFSGMIVVPAERRTFRLERHPMSSRQYGLFRFLLDVLLVVITGGFWLIWIFVREMRRR